MTFAAEITYDLNNAQLKEAFRLFDLDMDGLIDKREINDLIVYEKGSSEEFDEVVNDIDLNNDGKIDFEEFIQHVNKAVEKIRTKTDSIKTESKLTPSKEVAFEVDKTFILSERRSSG